jgi:cell wall integrity and stress response component
MWTVYLTGFTRNHIENLDPASLTSSSKPTKTAEQTVVVTASSSAKKGGNTVGIVVGVIVGLIIFAALAGAAFIFLRNRKQKEAEEYKRHNDVDAFVSGGGSQVSNDRPQMWASQDPRLDTDAAGRRASNGSIADNQDYSRRILAVRICFITDSKESFVLTISTR